MRNFQKGVRQKEYSVKIRLDSGIPDEIRRYCEEHSMRFSEFVNLSIAEKLQKMDVHSMTIAEIEEVERGEW